MRIAMIARGLKSVCLIFASFCLGLTGLDERRHAPSLDAQSPPPRQETALDRIVHIEKTLVTDVPNAPRWCDRLDLKKRRIDVGGPVVADAAELYVEEEGKGTALVLINGGPGGTHHYFHPWFGRARDFARVIYYDQRGCGLSDFKPGAGYSVDQAVDDLEKVRRAAGAGRWIVLGYSYGGFLAQYYAMKYPENTAGLVLMSASPGFSTGSSPEGWNDFLSKEEKERMKAVRGDVEKWAVANKISEERAAEVLLYNLDLNGSWKFQHLLKSSPERMAQMARYEWIHDTDFNSILNQSAGRVDLAGAFASCPIPTLILEGKYDPTWSPDKPALLLRNHPGAQMVMFEHASHPIYEEEPDRFFDVLGKYVRALPAVSPDSVAAYKKFADKRLQEIKSPPDAFLELYGWGRKSNEKLAKAYSRDWPARIVEPTGFLKVGLALYDVANYPEALFIFERMREAARRKGSVPYEAVALVWQGHMLDLMGKRPDAVARYKAAADMDVTGAFQHDQFGLRYAPSAYAVERLKEPFRRIENQSR